MQDRKSANLVPKPPPSQESLLDGIREWCRGRFWLPRAAVLAWFVWILVDLWVDPLVSGPFNWPNLFAGINLGIHELGHVVFGCAGEFLCIAGGTVLEWIAPVAAGAVLVRQRDWFGLAVAAGWLSTAMFDTAVYMADAQAQELPLVSLAAENVLHDWGYLLGAVGLLGACEGLALLLKLAASGLMLAALAFGAWLAWNMARGGNGSGSRNRSGSRSGE
jgi:hypothetical protein